MSVLQLGAQELAYNGAENTTVANVDFSHIVFTAETDDVEFNNVTFVNCKFHNVVYAGVSFEYCVFINCTFGIAFTNDEGAEYGRAVVGDGCTFVNCTKLDWFDGADNCISTAGTLLED